MAPTIAAGERDHALGRGCDHVAAGGAKPADEAGDGLLPAQSHDRAHDHLGADRRASGRVDVEHDAAHRLVVAQPEEESGELKRAYGRPDHALHVDDRHGGRSQPAQYLHRSLLLAVRVYDSVAPAGPPAGGVEWGWGWRGTVWRVNICHWPPHTPAREAARRCVALP